MAANGQRSARLRASWNGFVYVAFVTDVSKHSRDDLDAVASAFNSRPRKTLGWMTPAEVFDKYLCSLQQGSVATTP
jgi:IS30 family transposase